MTRPDEELASDARPEDVEPAERDLEAPTADAAEQAMSVRPAEEPTRSTRPRRGFDVGEWDAMEQSIVIDLDDDYDR